MTSKDSDFLTDEEAFAIMEKQMKALLWSNLPGHLNRWKIHYLRSDT